MWLEDKDRSAEAAHVALVATRETIGAFNGGWDKWHRACESVIAAEAAAMAQTELNMSMWSIQASDAAARASVYVPKDGYTSGRREEFKRQYDELLTPIKEMQ